VLSTLLTWMAENRKPVFIVATANDITELPPELVRKGRLDEIFFVDLPEPDPGGDLPHSPGKSATWTRRASTWPTGQAADGFTGAEIEEAIVSARYLASDRGLAGELGRGHRGRRAGRGEPHLPHVGDARREHQSLRDWARNRTVPA
jgi:SpoVK/Ycf46/Vps4 family AAA+-type ATPase